MKKSILIFAALFFCTFVSAQIVNIPDANFKAYLLADPDINTNGDNQIQVSEAINFNGSLECSMKSIKNLTGIEAFTNAKELDCSKNQLTSLDISKNTGLIFLHCGENQITSLDLSKNISLSNLVCYSNQLTNLELSKNIKLIFVECYDNRLATLDLSKNTMLWALHCDQNELTSLDVSKNTALVTLMCYENQLTNLDVTQNIKLASLDCDQNNLMTLDLSKNIYLSALDCRQNLLESLNIKSGYNTNISYVNLFDNPYLTCIQVDNAAYSTANWTSKDSWASYNTDCNYLSNNDVQKSGLRIYPNPVKNSLNIQTPDKLQKLEIYSANGQLVKTSFLKETSVANLPKGNYVAKITTDKGVQTEKIIKE